MCVTTSELDIVRDSEWIRGMWSWHRYWTDIKFVPLFEGSMNAGMLVNQENESD